MEKYEDLPIGIDLGTTFSCIGVYRNAAVEIIPNEKGDRTTPSIVSFLDDNIQVGEQTEYKRLKDPKNKIYAVKRIIGRNYDDKEVQEDISKFSYIVKNDFNRPKIEVNSNGIKRYSPEEISAKVLAKLKQSAESFLQQKIKKVVITVPAYFTERQKQATKNAGEIAGLEVIKIINEPTAASLAYGFGKMQNSNGGKLLGKNIVIDAVNTYRSNFYPQSNNKKETQNILVFDLGGGTLDVTLLELEEGDITVKSHSGKMHLGGEDFDNILVQYCIEIFRYKTSIDLNKEEFLKQKLRLKEHCEKAKRELSYKNEVEIEVESIAKGKDLYLKITRAKFEDLCKDLFNLCKEPILEVLEKSGDERSDIDEIVLVGGSTRIPKIQSMLKEFFNGKELNKKLNPDEAVAYGATIEAAIQMGEYAEDVVLLDVCPFSLGIAVVNDENIQSDDMMMSKVIKKGSKLPCKKMEVFRPAYDYAKTLLFQVYEGENKYVKDNYPLGSFRLKDLPERKKEDVHLEVTFELDEDSILTVTAVDRDNKNKSNSIVIKNDKGGLSRNEIENAIKNQKKEEETIGKDLEPAMIIEKNYKNEINKLFNKVNTLTDQEEQYSCLQLLQKCIENFIDTFNKENDNFTYKQKMHYYLTYLFNAYSCLLNFKSLISDEEKEDIITKVNNYLEIYKEKGTSFGSSLIKIFEDNEDDIFCNFCIQILGYYSQRGTEYYSNNDKKNSKHYLEEALSIIEKYSIKERVKYNFELSDRFNSIYDNCNELLNILKAESIEKYCKSFSKDILIKENEFNTEEEKIDILDRFKDGLSFLKDPKKRADKLLKAIYLANIVKIEYKMFNSNNYDTLLKMIEDCVQLKVQVPEGCEAQNLDWFNEICDIKTEIEEKQKNAKKNPKDAEQQIKKGLKDILDKLNEKYKQGRITFFFYILNEHKPIGLENDMIFSNPLELENVYYSDKKKFMKKLRRLYNPVRYKGDKEEEQKLHSIMQEISMKLNDFE